jgi:lipopolysaccharide transport system ATP-binding protein
VSDPIIRVENLGKKYILGHQKQQPYTALRDVIADGVKSFGRSLSKPFGKNFSDPAYEEFWALKDVSFEIDRGDRVGLIGRNGAGKSTLLKILSRIVEPTNGRIAIKGRVASLLEVGTGFHPELTGRENIYLNGAILGMSKAEIKQKFDEIVAFAEVERFLDTPVKRYSSGMYVRLAFAVAAHLEPEILLVDEVLAVGDIAFQKKCLGKMEDVSSKEGRTVLFVSHNLNAVEQLCEKSILVIEEYLSQNQADLFTWSRDLTLVKRQKDSTPSFRIERVELDLECENRDDNLALIEYGQPFQVILEAVNYTCSKPVSIAFCIKTITGEPVFTSHHHDKLEFLSVPTETRIKAICEVNPNILLLGSYTINLGITDESWGTIDYLEDAIGFEVIGGNQGVSVYDKRPGLIFMALDWELKTV